MNPEEDGKAIRCLVWEMSRVTNKILILGILILAILVLLKYGGLIR